MVENARTMPMSASVLVNRDDAVALVDDILRSFPEELRHARWLLKERDEFLGQARREADDIIELGPRAGRAHGRAHRDRPRGPPDRTADRRRRRGAGPPARARGRGLHRPEARRLRGRPRPHPPNRAKGPDAPPGRGRARSPPRARSPTPRASAASSSTRTAVERRRPSGPDGAPPDGVKGSNRALCYPEWSPDIASCASSTTFTAPACRRRREPRSTCPDCASTSPIS